MHEDVGIANAKQRSKQGVDGTTLTQAKNI